MSVPIFPDHPLIPPVSKYTGARSTLRYKPSKPRFLGSSCLPRQQQVAFDASGVSPLLQQYLDHHSDTAGRRPQSLKRTQPVKWCRTGGVDTWNRVRVSAVTDVTRDLMRDYKASKERTRSEAAAGVRSFVVARNELTKESNRVRDGGMNSVAKKAIEVMKATQARKGGGKRKEEVKEGGETSVFRKLKVHNI
ncbi:hypothetical protein TrRE_jg9006 [Triparma retinervis]|uniref:Uncharacterized protein n=1 Tax=Triparma retinervis TaxID=2557542 RepID=A0A9W7DUA1_9STRA|nr:hypothetical protein TrRE_jg9006 [Triparma retinervis]